MRSWRRPKREVNLPIQYSGGTRPRQPPPQFTGVLHREHAVVKDGVRTGKAMGLRNLPSKTWAVNCGWVLAANIAADLSAWSRLLGLYDCDDLKDAEPGHARHARQRVLKLSRTWPWKEAFLT